MKRSIFFSLLIIFLSAQAGSGSGKEKTYTVHHVTLDSMRGLTHDFTNLAGGTQFIKNGKKIVFYGSYVVIEE